MTFTKHLSIRAKLVLLTLLPLIGFICFAGHDLTRTYDEKIQLEETLILTKAAAVNSFLVHELQKERGASAGYLSSKGKKFKDIMIAQRASTDQKQQALQRFINNNKTIPALNALFIDISQQLNKLLTIRKRIDDFTISTADEVAFYTGLNAKLLSILDMAANNSSDTTLSVSAVTVSSFLQHKERAGIERAVLSNVFSINHFTPVFLEKFIRLLAEQDTYLNNFTAHATPAQQSIYAKNMPDNALKPVQDYRDLALSKMLTGGFNTDATRWFKTITMKINKLKEIENGLLNELTHQNQLLITTRGNSLIKLTILMAVPLLLVIFLSWYITKALQEGIAEITNKLTQINLDNDLTLRIEVESNDELGTISHTINKLVIHLQKLVTQIQTTSSTLKINVVESIENNHIIEGKVNSGIEQVAQVVTSTTEMSSTITEIARNALEASTETDKANAQGQEGNSEVEQTIDNINHIFAELTNASATVKKLTHSAQDIGQFLNAVKDISDKTNLLALNAAIEAARAGESGRGFAVVADEVRSLSMQTKKSTDEIEVMINALQSDAGYAEQAMKNGLAMIEKSVEDATQTGRDIAEITNCIQQINSMNEQIATSAEEQSSVTEEINRNMVNIQDGYAGIQTSYQILEKDSQRVGVLANELEQSVGAFKVK